MCSFGAKENWGLFWLFWKGKIMAKDILSYLREQKNMWPRFGKGNEWRFSGTKRDLIHSILELFWQNSIIMRRRSQATVKKATKPFFSFTPRFGIKRGRWTQVSFDVQYQDGRISLKRSQTLLNDFFARSFSILNN